jgi:hypothetical protein
MAEAKRVFDAAAVTFGELLVGAANKYHFDPTVEAINFTTREINRVKPEPAPEPADVE